MKKKPQKPLPPDVQQLIGAIWQEAQNHLDHDVPPPHREALCRALWPSLDLSGARREAMLQTGDLPLSDEDIQFGRLMVQTAKHVLPIWDQFATPGAHSGKGMGQEIRLPRWILEAAQDTLRERIEPLKAYEMLGDFYDLVAETAFLVPYPVWSVANSAYLALSAILGGACFPVAVDEASGVEVMGDDDPARYAASACVWSDDNPPGEWWGNAENALPFVFHAGNALGFWEWWLGAAIPAAWQWPDG